MPLQIVRNDITTMKMDAIVNARLWYDEGSNVRRCRNAPADRTK